MLVNLIKILHESIKFRSLLYNLFLFLFKKNNFSKKKNFGGFSQSESWWWLHHLNFFIFFFEKTYILNFSKK
jgi:hypothetical protein